MGVPKLPAFGKQLPTRSRDVVGSVGQSIPQSSGPWGTKGSPAMGAVAPRAGALCIGWVGACCATGSGTEGVWDIGWLQSQLGISHHPGGSGAPLHTLIPWAMAARLSLSASVRWPIRGETGRELQPLGTRMGNRDGCGGTGSLSAPLVPGEGASVGSRAQHGNGSPRGGGLTTGRVVCQNQTSLTKRATGEIWEERAVSGLPLTPRRTASVLPALCQVWAQRGAAFHSPP